VRNNIWNRTQDQDLRNLISTGAIDPTREADRNYIIAVTREHFPSFIGDSRRSVDNAVKRLRNKFRQWNLGKNLTGARQARKTEHDYDLSGSSLQFDKEAQEDQVEEVDVGVQENDLSDDESEEEEVGSTLSDFFSDGDDSSVDTMPAQKPKKSKTPPRAPKGSGKVVVTMRAPKQRASSKEDDEILASRLETIAISTRKAFCFKYEYPYLETLTGCIQNERYLIYDFHVPSLDRGSFHVEVFDDGWGFNLRTTVPKEFYYPDRLYQENKNLTNEHSLASLHNEVLENIFSKNMVAKTFFLSHSTSEGCPSRLISQSTNALCGIKVPPQ